MLKTTGQFGQQLSVSVPGSSVDVPAEVRIDPIELRDNIDGCCANASRCSQNGYVLARAVVLGMVSVLIQNCVQRLRWRGPLFTESRVRRLSVCVDSPFCIRNGGSAQFGGLVASQSLPPSNLNEKALFGFKSCPPKDRVQGRLRFQDGASGQPEGVSLLGSRSKSVALLPLICSFFVLQLP